MKRKKAESKSRSSTSKDTHVENRIRECRFAAGEMTQEELAKRVGVSRQTIVAIEKARYSPTLELAFKIARVFNTQIDAIFTYPDQHSEQETPQDTKQV